MHDDHVTAGHSVDHAMQVLHGTIAPETIGTAASNGCFRMINAHVIDLYARVPLGTVVTIL